MLRRRLYRPTAATLTDIGNAIGECKAETASNFVAYEVNVVHETTVEEDRDALIANVEAQPTRFGVQFLETDGADAEVLLRTKGGQRSAGQHFVLGAPPAFSTECQRVGDAWLLPLQTKHSKDWNLRSRTWLSLVP